MFKILDTLVIIVNTFSLIGMLMVVRSVFRCQNRQKNMLNTKASKIVDFVEAIRRERSSNLNSNEELLGSF
jgi:uncharacterized membrane protein